MHHYARQQEKANLSVAFHHGQNLFLVLAQEVLVGPLQLVDSPPKLHREIHIDTNSLSLQHKLFKNLDLSIKDIPLLDYSRTVDMKS
jgi:hypothetical protein